MHYKGTISKLTSMVRAEVHSCLDLDSIPPPTLPNENLIINELVLEYLKFNGYGHAASVLRAESGQPKEGSVDVAFVKSELGVSESRSMPALYGIVSVLKKNKSKPATLQGLKQSREFERTSNENDPSKINDFEIDEDHDDFNAEKIAEGSAWAQKGKQPKMTSTIGGGVTGRMDPDPLVFGGY
ncbi:hypothetical protein TL16_g12111 [Triparma laevis f. inornata]|uniref:FGFR1 oncogene partner (FOP) N-terminal dimerisation domain-containing protein n=1 Tax=Triparma laevis f. inornata TaxID=1714386 RepID=A0A9W7BNE2_9STRA|nr:hypothetical protein TL16_g12111 [Triparma laevis f. inornata]